MSCAASSLSFFFFFNDTATTEIYTLSLHDALPILDGRRAGLQFGAGIFVDPICVTDGHRTVSGGTAPIALPPRLQGDGTFNVADARDARGRIRFLFLARLRLRSHNTQKTGETQQQT